jgi:hypothetical protein
VAVTHTELLCRLRELFAALDREAPRLGHAANAAIARDAAASGEKALNPLAEMADQTRSPADVPLDRVR